MQFRLRTLLIVLSLGPMVLACAWILWKDWRERSLEIDVSPNAIVIDRNH